MKILINNAANIPNKYIRFIKWKLYKLNRKYKESHYVEVYINAEGSSQPLFQSIVKLNVPGNYIIITHKHKDLKQLWKESLHDVERYLRKWKQKSRSQKKTSRLIEVD